jgi:hypothetical protein
VKRSSVREYLLTAAAPPARFYVIALPCRHVIKCRSPRYPAKGAALFRLTLARYSETTNMDNEIREMARRCYGYGRWEAPYWFIGPEPGQGHKENDDLTLRYEAWLHFGGSELSDCRSYHNFMNERAGRSIMQCHREKRPPLQRTWGPLILLLMAFLQRPTDDESQRIYQRDRWGMLDGETCVIELSGLAANSFAVRRNRSEFRSERIAVICQRIRTYKPAFVVMYGVKDKKPHWEEIAEGEFPANGIRQLHSTMMAFAPHPSRPTRPRKYWIGWGERLRQVARRS